LSEKEVVYLAPAHRDRKSAIMQQQNRVYRPAKGND